MVHQQDKHTSLSLLTSHRAESRLTRLTTFNLFSNKIKSIIHRNLHILHCDAKLSFCSIRLQSMSYRRDHSAPSSTDTLISSQEYFSRFKLFCVECFGQQFFQFFWLHILDLLKNLLRQISVGKIRSRYCEKSDFFFLLFPHILVHTYFSRFETKKLMFQRCFKIFSRLQKRLERLI